MSIKILPHPKREDAPVGRSQADQVCKAPVCYGWAWHPILLVSGIWQRAYIETRSEDYIFNPTVTYRLSEDLKAADVEFNWECSKDVRVTLLKPDRRCIMAGL